MDCFSLVAALPLAQVAAPDTAAGATWKVVAVLAGGQLLSIVAYWIASKIMIPDDATWINALKTWGLYIGGFLGVGLLAAACWYFLASHPAGLIVTVVGFVVLMITLLFQVPMKVYQLSFAPALGFIAISLILTTAAQTLLSKSLGVEDPTTSERQLSQFTAAIRQMSGGRGRPGFDESIVGDPNRPLAERHAALQQIHRELQRRHSLLKKGDQRAIQAYARDQARYDELVREIAAESRR